MTEFRARPIGGWIEAAVLVPVFRDPAGELRLVLVRRAKGGVHGGQIAFPGGKRDGADPSFEATALREAEEEVGLSADRVEILTRLNPTATLTSGFRVHPFLARIRPPDEWRLADREIAELFQPTIESLAQADSRGRMLMEDPSWPSAQWIDFIHLGPHKLWGLSYRILEPLLSRILAGEWAL